MLIDKERAIRGIKRLFKMGKHYCDEQSIIGFLNTIQPEQRWIPVTEQLPKDFVMVLMSVYQSDKTYNQYPYLRIGYYHNNDWFPVPQRTLTSPPFDKTLSQYDGGDPVVTAWAYLPKPWEGDAG